MHNLETSTPVLSLSKETQGFSQTDPLPQAVEVVRAEAEGIKRGLRTWRPCQAACGGDPACCQLSACCHNITQQLCPETRDITGPEQKENYSPDRV